jgi:hypothetical protein
LLNSEALRQQLVSPKPVGVSIDVARHNLRRILAQPEFSALTRQPTWWDGLKSAIAKWMTEHLLNLFKAMAQHPTTSQIIFWAAVAGSLAVIAFVLFRLFAPDGTGRSVVLPASVSQRRTSVDWIRTARSAAQSGDLNKAIQCLYWAAVSWLETAGVLNNTSGLTPRELLRSIAATGEAAEFRNLTLSIERFWYGHGAATTADFSACLRSLKALGCPVE